VREERRGNEKKRKHGIPSQGAVELWKTLRVTKEE
jgi:hypothetical protein